MALSIGRFLAAGLVVLALHGAARAQVPPARSAAFPGAAIGRSIRGEAPEDLMRALYAARDRRNPTYANPMFCGHAPCKLQLLAADAWQGEDGAERILIVAGAEPPNPSHSSPAMLGMAVLRRQNNAWLLEAGSPNVDEIGEWGQPPPISTVLAGGFGRGAVASPQFTAQGVQLSSWGLYVPIDDRIVKVLQLETGQDSAASCEAQDAICRRRADAQDFSSEIKTEPTQDGGLDVVQTIVLAARPGMSPQTRRWHIAPTGKVNEIGAGLGRRDR
jgi:hypothetical protein